MGRRAQANARTLTWAVRKLFQPVLTEIPPTEISSTTSNQNSQATVTRHQYSEDLISTQPAIPSEKALGKRKRLEPSTVSEDDADADSRDRSLKSAHDSDPSQQTRYARANLPPALQKYWKQRYRLFSRYDEGIRMDYDGWFSVTPEDIAAQIAERCRCSVIVDAFCGVGGNAIQFAMTCQKVIAIDISPVRLACAKANAEIYGVEEYISFVQADYVEWAKARAKAITSGQETEKIDVVFMSPPWGGIEYLQDEPEGTSTPTPNPMTDTPAKEKPYSTYSLSRLSPLHGKDLFDLSRELTKNIAYFLPRNQDIEEAAALVTENERVECEEEWMGYKLKALTFYYGDLVKP